MHPKGYNEKTTMAHASKPRAPDLTSGAPVTTGFGQKETKIADCKTHKKRRQNTTDNDEATGYILQPNPYL
jgi:hypothetical protein